MERKAKYSISLSVRAKRELETSFTWYEDQQKGLGSRFIQEVLLKILTIAQSPELFSIKGRSYREARTAIFPYLIVYKINKKNVIRVISVFHTAQHPKRKYQ